MQKYILLFFLLSLSTLIEAQNIVEKFKSEPGERWFSRAEILDRTSESSTSDLNGDGKFDIITLDWIRDSMFFRATVSIDEEPLIFTFTESEFCEVDRPNYIPYTLSNLRSWGLYDVDGKGYPELLLFTDLLTVINLDDNNITCWGNTFGAFDVDGDQLVDFIQFDKDKRQTTIYGLASEGEFKADSELIQVTKSNNFNVINKYESVDTNRIGFAAFSLEKSSDFDVNGDGIVDIPLVREDQDGNAIGFRVINGKNGNAPWQMMLPDDDDLQNGLQGFFDVDGNGQKEAYFGNRTVIDQEGNLSKLPEDFEVFGFIDVDGDDQEDILGYNTSNNRFTILGAPVTTSTNDNWAQNLGLTIYPNFPNPVQVSTTFKFEIEDSQRVRLDILHLNGQILTNLIDESISAGSHYVNWNSASLPAGMYLYRFTLTKGSITKALVKQ